MSEKPKRRGRKTDLTREAAPSWAQRLRVARVGAGLTVAALADATDLTRDAISRYEAGDRKPSVFAGIALARALATTAEKLFG